jgi:hypothetical protein
MNWKEITTIEEWNSVLERSTERGQAVLKHSTTCPVSSNALEEYNHYLHTPILVSLLTLPPEPCSSFSTSQVIRSSSINIHLPIFRLANPNLHKAGLPIVPCIVGNE